MNDKLCISADQIEKYLAGEADADAAVRLENHLSQCNACSRKIETFKNFTAAWDGWTAARHGDAWRRSDEEERTASHNAVVEILGNAGGNGFDALTELEKKRIEKWDREYVPPPRTRERAFSSARDGEDFMLLAAAPKPVRPARGSYGEALGVAVDEKTGRGAILRVSARVGKDIKEKGSVRIVGSQVEGRSKNGLGYRTTPPLELLGNRLHERFKAPALAPLELHKRDVYIEVENTDYLSRSGSLMLTAIAAVVKAAVGETGFDNLVYSADVDLDGEIQEVGSIADKAEFVFSDESFGFATARGDRAEIPAHLLQAREKDVYSFHDISELLDHLGIRIKEGARPAAPAPSSRRKYIGPIRTPMLLLALAALAFMAFSSFVAGHFYGPADVITLFHLKSSSYNLINYARTIDSVLWKVLGLLVVFLAIVMFRGGKTTAAPWLKKIGGYPLELTLGLLAVLYFGLNVHMLAGESPDNFKNYERVEHLVHNEYFKEITRDIPDYRYMEFEKFTAGGRDGDLEQALRIGLEIRPTNPRFKKAFVGMAGVLMDRVNNMAFAKRLLESYIRFTDSIKGNPDAKRWAADTIDAAEDLMNRYTLKETFYGEKRFGALIGEVVTRYGL